MKQKGMLLLALVLAISAVMLAQLYLSKQETISTIDGIEMNVGTFVNVQEGSVRHRHHSHSTIKTSEGHFITIKGVVRYAIVGDPVRLITINGTPKYLKIGDKVYELY